MPDFNPNKSKIYPKWVELNFFLPNVKNQNAEFKMVVKSTFPFNISKMTIRQDIEAFFKVTTIMKRIIFLSVYIE
jgi:hypothetical protein